MDQTLGTLSGNKSCGKTKFGIYLWPTYIIAFNGIKQSIPKIVLSEKVRLGVHHVYKHIC